MVQPKRRCDLQRDRAPLRREFGVDRVECALESISASLHINRPGGRRPTGFGKACKLIGDLLPRHLGHRHAGGIERLLVTAQPVKPARIIREEVEARVLGPFARGGDMNFRGNERRPRFLAECVHRLRDDLRGQAGHRERVAG